MRINTNAPAINAHRNLINNQKSQAKTLEKLSSGLKINRGADSPHSCRYLNIYVLKLQVLSRQSTTLKWQYL